MADPKGRVVRASAIAGVVAGVVVAVSACATTTTGQAEPEHRSFSLHGRTLSVDSDDSALKLVPSDGAKVEVTRWFEGKTAFGPKPRATWDWGSDKDQLTLRLTCSGVSVSCKLRHRIEVPRGVALVVRNSDGKVRADGFSQPIDVDSRDGEIKITNSSGALNLRSSDGAITATDLTSRRVAVTSRDGAVRLGLRTAPDSIDAKSSDAAITIELPGTERYRVHTKTADGAVDVAVPRDHHSDHRVAARARDGKITIRSTR